MMILLNAATGLAVNPKLIAAIKIVEIPSLRVVITMKDGFELAIHDAPNAGIDVVEIHRRLMVSV
ncbi:hypothetical protein J3Q09_17625 [Pseudomonas sp. R4-83]|uniref:hypothetical protein n=1 Tax=unclassified Pseudomonas TaxID=196821 RepID=UPI003DA820B2